MHNGSQRDHAASTGINGDGGGTRKKGNGIQIRDTEVALNLIVVERNKGEVDGCSN